MSRIIRATDDPLVAFLYTLLQDHLAPGDAERALARIRDNWPSDSKLGIDMPNAYIADYAKDLVDRIQEIAK